MKKIYVSILALFSVATLNAQSITDALRFSQYDYSMGTARSAAMGGAFASLGADLSSMAINPAGLGMYRSSDVGISSSIAVNSIESVYSGNSSTENRTRFSVSNFGVALNYYQGTGTLKSITFGIGYNKLADFNTTQYLYGQTPLNSITEVFAEQLGGVSQSTLNKGGYTPYNNVSTSQWGGVLAWQTGVLDPATNSSGDEVDGAYTPFFNLDPSASVDNAMRIVSSGYVAEYDLSMGFNVDNLLYLGFTLGIQDLNYKSTNQYDESYSVSNSTYTLEGILYDRYSQISGVGMNLKIGAIFNPINLLRIGVAYHSPTWFSLETTNIDYMGAVYNNSSYEGMLDTPYLLNEITIKSPSRLLAGMSLAIPRLGIISADYERVWYQGIRMGYGIYDEYAMSSYDQDITNMAKEMYKPANNFRFGLELTPTDKFYIRAGYAIYDSAFEYDDQISPNGYADRTSWTNISGGLGFRFANTYLDITYIYSLVDYTIADIFYYSYSDGDNDVVIESGTFTTQLQRNSVTLTLGSRF